MTIASAKNTPRVAYTATTNQTTFTIPFEFFSTADVKVYNGTSLLTYNASPSSASQYSIAGTASASDSAFEFGSGGTITLGSTGASNGDIITIIRDITIERTSDFPVSGSFDITSLNTDLDKIYAKLSDIKQQSDRSVKLLDTDSIAATMTLPAKATRASKVLFFDANGVPETTLSSANLTTLGEKTTEITTVANNISNVNTTAANIGAVNTVASDLATVAAITSDVTAVGAIGSNVTTVAGIAANVTTVASNISSVNTVAGDITKVVAVANDLAETVSEIETVADDLNETSSEIEVVAGSIANVNTVGGAIANVNTAAGNINNINAVAGQILFTEDLGDLGALTTGSGNTINTVATDIANVNTLAGISSNITTVAGISSNVTTVAGISANVTTVASNDSNVTAVAGNATNINAVAGNATNINTVAGANANITTVATNISGVNSFADRYRVGSSDPTSSLDEGDLFYNSTENAVKYYTGSTWASITAGLGNIVEDTTPQLGGALDGQDNNMSNIGTIDGTNLQIDFGGIT